MADESAMVIIWPAIALLVTVAVFGALMIYPRLGHSTDSTRPTLQRRKTGRSGARMSTEPDAPDIEMVDLHAEASMVPRHYQAARLVTWSVNRCGDSEEMNDESPG